MNVHNSAPRSSLGSRFGEIVERGSGYWSRVLIDSLGGEHHILVQGRDTFDLPLISKRYFANYEYQVDDTRPPTCVQDSLDAVWEDAARYVEERLASRERQQVLDLQQRFADMTQMTHDRVDWEDISYSRGA